MSKQQIELQNRLLADNVEPGKQERPAVAPAEPQADLQQFQYRQKADEPKIKLSKPMILILGPLLVIMHFWISDLAGIPVLQYAFVTCLSAFLINYMGIIRRYELYPYLPNSALDNRLKLLCIVSFVAVVSSMYLGWNGSGGLLFAMFWEITRGQKMNMYGVYFGAIIVGSLLMEQNYSSSKIWEFLPGLMLGFVNSEIFKLKESNEYTIVHQFLFACSIGFPIFFPATDLVVPKLWQWGVMIVCGGLMLVTLIVLVKLQQLLRVSVVVGVTSGLLMAGTSPYTSNREYIGVILILIGIVMMLRTEFADAV